MDKKSLVIIGIAVLAIIVGYVAMEWSASNGHWNDAGDNWSR